MKILQIYDRKELIPHNYKLLALKVKLSSHFVYQADFMYISPTNTKSLKIQNTLITDF